VPVWVHEADAGRARGEGKPAVAWGRVRPLPLLRFLGYAARRGGLRTTYLREVRTFTAGERLPVPGAPLVVAMPGHSPGSVALHVPALDAVVVGEFTDDPRAALDSLAALERLDARWVLPGHGAPWGRGAAEAVRHVRQATPAA